MTDALELRAKLLGSLLLFTQTFYKLRTGREFEIPATTGRESHVYIVMRELKKMFNLETKRLLINLPPGHFKSTIVKYFIAWAMARYPDCNFLYISYSHDLAANHTADIKKIMELPAYRKLFNIEISRDSSAKDNFKTLQGGCVAAFGSSGGVTGRDAGLPEVARFSGCVVMDDMHKPDEVYSETMRERVKTNYIDTIAPRPRSPKVPLLFIGQRLHEDDLPANFVEAFDGHEWKKVILKALDENGNPLAPSLMTYDDLRIMQERQPYKFASQYQQDPQPAGGGIFKPEWFKELDEEPQMLATFITADTAETDKNYNDPTVFSFWGIYKINIANTQVEVYGLHWLDCVEDWIEPKDLQNEFMQFWADCMRHPVKPLIAAIEAKSTGVTLQSTLQNIQGLQVLKIDRTRASLSKVARYFEIQPYVSSKHITLPRHGKHNARVIEHMRKITANNTHRHDDICDTAYDAIKLALIDKTISFARATDRKIDDAIAQSVKNFNKLNQMRYDAWK